MAKATKMIAFPEYAPDVSPLGQAEAQIIYNVVPRQDGYGPIQSLETFTDSLPGPCRGYFFGRKTDGSITIFAGTASDLYALDNTTYEWINMSKGGVPYGSVPGTDNWQFVQFNNLVIAVQQNCPPQKFALGGAGTFVDLGGDPPFAGSVSIIGFFVVLTALQLWPQRAQWSDIDAPEQWTAGMGLSDYQDFPDGGSCVASSGGDAYGMIFQESSIRSMTYAAGSVAIFQFYRVSTQEALYGKYSIINIGNRVFWLGAAGFKMSVGAADPVPIGKERIDRTFFLEVDPANPQLIIGASGPTTTRVYWAYKSIFGTIGQYDRVLIYDYVLNKWTRVNMSGEYLASLAKPGLTLEQMDTFTAQQIKVQDAQNNGAGLIRLTVDAVSNSTFSIASQPFSTVQGVKGTTEANGVWRMNVIDPTHVDLIGSSFLHPYVSGGAIGGSIETITFSFDSIPKAAITQLSGFDVNHALGFFTGPTLEALLETGDGDGEGTFLFTDSVMPITDASQVFCSIGWRNSPQAPIAYAGEQPIDDQGTSPIDPIEARYQRFRVRIVGGSAWTYARGVQPATQPGGER